MSDNKFVNVDKKMKACWIIRRLHLLLVPIVILLFALFIDELPFAIKLLLFIVAGLACLYAILRVIVFPHLEYKKYMYLIKDDEVVLMRGVFFKTTTVVPIIQMQDVGYAQGPLAQVFGIASVVISTAGSNLFIDGIKKEDAIRIVDDLKERIKKYVMARDEAK